VVHRYYANLDRHLLSRRLRSLDLREHAPHLLVIPIGRRDRISPKPLTYSLRLSPDVTALHCTELGGPDAEEEKTKIRGARSAATTIEELKHRHPDDAIQHHVNLRLGLCVTCEISQLKRVMPTLNLRRS
jgi:hypothetical protein